MISAGCVARDLHTITPRPLERTCWRQFAAQWGDCTKSHIAPCNAIIIMIKSIVHRRTTPNSNKPMPETQDTRMPQRLERKDSFSELWERWSEALETYKAAQWWRQLQSKDHPGREQQVTDWETSCWQVGWKLCKWEQDSRQCFKAKRSKERDEGKNSQQNSHETHAPAPQT